MHMSQQEFNELLKRYLEGQTTEQEDEFLVRWYESPANQVKPDLPEFQKQTLEKRMWRAIREQISPVKAQRSVRLAWLSGLAASLILGGVWLYPDAASSPPTPLILAEKAPEQTGIEVRNSNQTEQEVALPDGTTVRLAPGSSLVYEKAFDRRKREVYLRGEAFFKVKRDVAKPFVVHAGELVTEVLGTSFRIRQNEKGKTTEVAVLTGKVSVYTTDESPQRERNGIIITQNQRVKYDAATRKIVPGLVENPSPIAAAVVPAALVFQETSLEKVLAELTHRYGIEFVISNPKLKECRITADLQGLSLFTQLELLCKSIDATYETRGTVVFIDGSGC